MTRILFLVLAAAATSCVEIDGGAVEASWVVRSDDGRAIRDCGCAEPAIARVRISLLGLGALEGHRPCQTGGRPRPECEFSCGRESGATPFDIPPGSYVIWLTPADAAGQDLTMPAAGRGVVRTPAPILREVIRGQPTQLEAYLLEAQCSSSCAGSNNSKVCAQ